MHPRYTGQALLMAHCNFLLPSSPLLPVLCPVSGQPSSHKAPPVPVLHALDAFSGALQPRPRSDHTAEIHSTSSRGCPRLLPQSPSFARVSAACVASDLFCSPFLSASTGLTANLHGKQAGRSSGMDINSGSGMLQLSRDTHSRLSVGC